MTRRQLLQGIAAMPIGFAGVVSATAQGNRDVAYGGTTLPAGIRSRLINNVNGITYHVLEAGFEGPARPCVLLIHGFPELAYSWRKVILPLSRAGFHVIAPDLRGYGRSGGTDVTYDDNLEPFTIVVECHIRTAAAPVTSKVGCDDMKSRARERQNHFSPAIGEFRESMNEQDAWPCGAFESCFQYVISDAVDVVDEARTNARRKSSPAVGYISVSLRCRAYRPRKADRHGRNSLKKLTPRHCFPSSRLPLFVLFYDACATAHQNLYCRSFLNGLVSCWRAGSSTEPKIEPVLRLVVGTIFSGAGLHSEAAIVTPSVSAITASDIGIGI